MIAVHVVDLGLIPVTPYLLNSARCDPWKQKLSQVSQSQMREKERIGSSSIVQWYFFSSPSLPIPSPALFSLLNSFPFLFILVTPATTQGLLLVLSSRITPSNAQKSLGGVEIKPWSAICKASALPEFFLYPGKAYSITSTTYGPLKTFRSKPDIDHPSSYQK